MIRNVSHSKGHCENCYFFLKILYQLLPPCPSTNWDSSYSSSSSTKITSSLFLSINQSWSQSPFSLSQSQCLLKLHVHVSFLPSRLWMILSAGTIFLKSLCARIIVGIHKYLLNCEWGLWVWGLTNTLISDKECVKCKTCMQRIPDTIQLPVGPKEEFSNICGCHVHSIPQNSSLPFGCDSSIVPVFPWCT